MVTRTLAVRSISLLVLFILSQALLCSAQDLPGILMDLAPGYDRTPSSNPSNFTRSGPYVYFTASENPNSTTDTRLWRTDGTLEGTRMVARSKNLVQPTLLTDVNGTLYFSSNGLWKTNGTDAGTIKLSDVQPTQMAAVGNQLWILVAKTNALELWKSSGTIAGTSMAFSLPTAATPQLRNLKGISGKLYFAMDDGSGTGRVAWCSNGTAAGTVKLSNAVTTFIQTFTEFEGKVYYGALQGQLWKTNGTAAGTSLLKTFAYTDSGTTMSLSEFAGALYIGVYDGLYKSDGTSAGTVPAITFESATPFPKNLTVFQDMLLFTASPQSNLCLMRTDGAQTGTSIISDLGYYGFRADNFMASMNYVYFSLADVRLNLFVSDGTPSGTFSLPSMYSPGALLGDKMIGGGSGSEPWITDGTVASTQMLKEICRKPWGLGGGSTFKTSSKAVFCTAGPIRTKGAKATTDRITGTTFSPNQRGFSELGSRILFCGIGPEYELCQVNTEGSAIAGRLKDINSAGNSYPDCFVTTSSHAWFKADDGVHGYELWKSDGTEARTQMVKDINPGPGNGANFDVGQIVQMNGTVYFSGNNGVNGYDLWKSDGTEVGTQVVKNFESSNSMSKLVVAGDKVFWGQGSNLYASDGSFDGTILLKTYTNSSRGYMAAFKNAIFFTFDYSSVLAFSDGTPAGTQSFGAYDGIGGIAVLDDKLLFCGRANGTGSTNNLFVSDGTVAGTQFLANVSFSSGSVANGIFYFAYDDTEHGTELWQTDGTPEGTHLAFDIYPGPTSSSPANLASCQGKLYFTAVDPFCGREIFVYPMEGLRESVTSYFDQGDTAARKIGNTGCTLDFVSNVEGGEVRVNAYTIDPPRYRGKALKKHWEVLGLYDQDFSVDLSFGYTPNELIAAGVTEEELRLLKSEDEGLSWTEVPCDVLADVNRVKTRHPQTSLSLWAIAGSKAAIPPSAWQAYE